MTECRWLSAGLLSTITCAFQNQGWSKVKIGLVPCLAAKSSTKNQLRIHTAHVRRRHVDHGQKRDGGLARVVIFSNQIHSDQLESGDRRGYKTFHRRSILVILSLHLNWHSSSYSRDSSGFLVCQKMNWNLSSCRCFLRSNASISQCSLLLVDASLLKHTTAIKCSTLSTMDCINPVGWTPSPSSSVPRMQLIVHMLPMVA